MVDRFELSDREIEVLELLANGAGNNEIASHLGISTNTVKVHVRNIYTKLGVNSRTEAVMFAIRNDLVSVEGVVSENNIAASMNAFRSLFTRRDPAGRMPRSLTWHLTLTLVGVLLISIVGMLILVREGQNVLGNPQNLEPENQRWTTIATLPTARRGLAVTAVGNWIYAIGGETESGIVGRVERFDPVTNSWEQLADKPLPVTDIDAAAVGGLIFVPGGRLADGEITSAVEVFDPRSGTWWNVSPLPKALSAYACVAFEGKLYTFGGWDGQNYVDTVFSYDPQRNVWTEGTAMEFPAGLAAAEVSGDAIFVMGGVNNSGILDINYAYFPQYEFTDEPPWLEKSPIPEGRYAFGMIGVADILHVLGGIGTEGNPSPYKYFPHEDTWQIFKHPDGQNWSYFDGTAIETQLYFLGGQIDNTISDTSLTYKAIFTISLPIVK